MARQDVVFCCAGVRFRGTAVVAQDEKGHADDSARPTRSRHSSRIDSASVGWHPRISCSAIARAIPCVSRSCCGACCNPHTTAAGLGRVTWHQFRHIHSSLLNDLKVPVKIAQQQLGHASISTTLNLYTHVVDASHREAVAVEAKFVCRSGVDPRWVRCPRHRPRQVWLLVQDWRRRPDLNRGWRFAERQDGCEWPDFSVFWSIRLGHVG